MITEAQVIVVFGSIITGLALLVLGILKWSFSQRTKSQEEKHAFLTNQLDGIKGELGAVKTMADATDKYAIQLEGSVKELNATLTGVQGFLKRVHHDNEKLWEKYDDLNK